MKLKKKASLPPSAPPLPLHLPFPPASINLLDYSSSRVKTLPLAALEAMDGSSSLPLPPPRPPPRAPRPGAAQGPLLPLPHAHPHRLLPRRRPPLLQAPHAFSARRSRFPRGASRRAGHRAAAASNPRRHRPAAVPSAARGCCDAPAAGSSSGGKGEA